VKQLKEKREEFNL